LIRGREKDERHLEVLGGNVETDGGGGLMLILDVAPADASPAAA